MGNERTTCRKQFSLSNIWILRAELRSSGLVIISFTHGAISLVPKSSHSCGFLNSNHLIILANEMLGMMTTRGKVQYRLLVLRDIHCKQE